MNCTHPECASKARTKGLCHKHYNAQWRLANLDKARSYGRGKDQRANNLKRYNLTLAEFEAMSAAQGHVCKICKRPPRDKKGRLQVDHCHTTGRVRGLLCLGCNVMLGKAEDSAQTLKNGAEYLTGGPA